MRIEESIQRRFEESGAAVFLPEQFIDEGLGDAPAVLGALKALEEDGYLRARAELRCAFDHPFWGGKPEEVPAHALMGCPVPDCPSRAHAEEAEEDEDVQPYVVLRYQLSAAWMSQLSPKGGRGQKKNPARRRLPS